MLQENGRSPLSEAMASPTVANIDPLAKQAERRSTNPSLLPNSVYFALWRQLTAGAALTAKQKSL